MKKTTAKTSGFYTRMIALGMMFFMIVCGSIVGLRESPIAHAATNNTINFQARLMTSSGAIVPDGNYNVEFKIYNASTSSGSSQGSCSGDSACLWTETRTSGNVVRVANGYLTVELGSVTTLPSIDWSQNLYLTMNIGGTGSPVWDGEMSPRLHLTAVPHAFTADQLSNTNGSNQATLGFTTPTANRSLLLPDESGTLCIQNSTACGFAISTGSTNYIQNQNSSDQTANFRISGTGQAAASFLTPLLDTATATALGIGTTNATAINLNKSTTITGGVTQSGGAISLAGNAASSITTSTGALTLSAAGTSNWTVGGTNQSLTITTSGTGVLTLGTTGAGTVTLGSSSSTVNIGITNNTHTVHIADGGTSTTQTVTIGSTNGSSKVTLQGGTSATAINLTTGTNGKINLSAGGTGSVATTIGSGGFKISTSTNSDYALSVQDASSLYAFSVSTNSGIVTIGALQASYSGFDETLDTPFGNLTVGSPNTSVTIAGDAGTTIQATSGSFATTLSFATPTANRSIVLPDEAGTLCIRNSTNCGFAPTTGSTNYIQNTTTNQSANIAVQAATSGSVTAVLQANAAGTGDILDLKNGAGTAVTTFSSTGSALFKNSANSTAALSVQNATGTSVLIVDTTNKRVGIGGVTAPAVALDVSGAVQQTGLMTSDTQGTDAGKWTQLGTCTITAQYQQCLAAVSIIGGHDGATADNTYASMHIRVKQQNALGGAPYVNVTLDPSMSVINKDAISAVTTTNSGTTTVVQLWGKITNSYEHWFFTPIINTGNSGAATWTWSESAGFSAALPTGTATNATYATSYVDTLTIRNATNSSSALQVQNAAGTSIFNVDTNTGLVSQSVGLRLNVNTTTDDSFTTPLGSSVGTAINIPLYNPGAYGQILAFGLPSTADSTARGISVFDARTSGTIQPAIALFSPNENDLFGLSWNGLNTTASLETASAAIALRPGGTNIKLWAGSTGVAIGSNVSSAAYPLDVTGDINTSTALRIAGTSVCDTAGSTGCLAKSGSGYYIHNDTALQASANFNISGTGIAATALQAPLFDTPSGTTTLNIGTTNATAININQDATLATGNLLLSNSSGNTIRSTTGALSIRAYNTNTLTLNTSGAGTVNLGTDNTTTINVGGGNDTARTYNIGHPLSGTATQTVNLGSQNGSSVTNIQGGTGTSAISVAPASGGNIKLTTTGTGSINLTPGNSGVFVQPTTDSTSALQVIATASGNSVLRVDTSGERVGVGVISDPISAKLSIATASMAALRAYQGGSYDAFQLGNDSDDFLTVSSTGNFLLKPTTNSASAFRIQNSGGSATLFTVDTSGNNIQIGSSTANSTATVLTLDSSSSTSDPTGIAGAMYYSTTYSAMRCYQDGTWANCSDPTRLSHGYNIQEEFVASSSSGANYTCGSGTMGATYAWACNTSGTSAAVGPVTADLYNRPGQMQLSTGTTTTGVASMYLAGGTTPAFFFGGGESFETAVNIPTLSTASQGYLIRIGLCDNNAHAGACSNGAYFEYNLSGSSTTSWSGKVVKGGTSASTSTTKTVATGWTNLKFVATSANSVTFYVKGPGETSYTSLGAIGSSTSVPNASANATTVMSIIDRTVGSGTAASTFKVDYVDFWNDFRGDR